jgi:hypothetical protein
VRRCPRSRTPGAASHSRHPAEPPIASSSVRLNYAIDSRMRLELLELPRTVVQLAAHLLAVGRHGRTHEYASRVREPRVHGPRARGGEEGGGAAAAAGAGCVVIIALAARSKHVGGRCSSANVNVHGLDIGAVHLDSSELSHPAGTAARIAAQTSGLQQLSRIWSICRLWK